MLGFKSVATVHLFTVLVLVPSCVHDETWVAPPGLKTPPPARGSSITGSQFVAMIKNKSQAQVEKLIYARAANGDFPNFLRTLESVSISATSPRGTQLHGTIYVLRDYFSIGKDSDYIRVPMNPITADRVARRLGLMLPTTKMVDQIYKAAKIKLSPKPMPPGRRMTSVDYFVRHNKMVSAQLAGASGSTIVRALIAGHKKDVVLSKRLTRKPRRVAIYGWHRRSGRPIQPLSLVHGDHYADYSHGIRFIAPRAKIAGKFYDLRKLMTHPTWGHLFSNEGPIRTRSDRYGHSQESNSGRTTTSG